MVNEERRFPPIAELAIVTMTLIIIGGIYIAGKLPESVPLALPIVLLIAAAAVLLVNVYLLTTLHDFAWDSFFLVAKWSLLAYLVIAGMLEYIFIYDDTPAKVMAILTGMLTIYAIDIPLLFAFSVARYQAAPSSKEA
jgi:hypothetical protein